MEIKFYINESGSLCYDVPDDLDVETQAAIDRAALRFVSAISDSVAAAREDNQKKTEAK